MTKELIKIKIEILEKDEEYFLKKIDTLFEYSNLRKDLPLKELDSFVRLLRVFEIRNQKERNRLFKEKVDKAINNLYLKYEFEITFTYEWFIEEGHEVVETCNYHNLTHDVIRDFVFDGIEGKLSSNEQGRVEICKRVITWCQDRGVTNRKFSDYKRAACAGDICQSLGYGVINKKTERFNASTFQNKMRHHYKKAKAELDKKS